MAVQGVASDGLPERMALIRRLLAERYGEAPGARRAARFLERLERRIVRPPRAVILGEANSGKSSLANLLLGFDLLTTDLVRNTRIPVRLTHGHAPAVRRIGRNGEVERLGPDSAPAQRDATRLIEVALPIARLTRFEPVDTPALEMDDGTIEDARILCQSAHMAIWCTVATQAWRASEAALWSSLGKRFERTSILAVTHAGILSMADREKVLRRLERETAGRFRSIVLVPEDGRSLAPTQAGCTEQADHRADAVEIAAIVSAVTALAEEVQRARLGRVTATVHRFADHLDGDEPMKTGRAIRRLTEATDAPIALTA